MMMPHVLRFNNDVVESRYRELVYLLPEVSGTDRRSSGEVLADRFTHWLTIAGLAVRLSDLPTWSEHAEGGQVTELLNAMADMAVKQWTGSFNPRPATREDYLSLYQAAL
jgi:alcohol dehydrogenase class IV